MGGVDGGAGGSGGPTAQQAGGTRHAPPSKMHARQPHPGLAASKPAIPTAALATSRAPGEIRPRGWGAGMGWPGGLLGGPKSPAQVLLSAEFRLRQFGRSGGRSSPRLTSALPPAGGQHHFSFASSREVASCDPASHPAPRHSLRLDPCPQARAGGLWGKDPQLWGHLLCLHCLSPTASLSSFTTSAPSALRPRAAWGPSLS